LELEYALDYQNTGGLTIMNRRLVNRHQDAYYLPTDGKSDLYAG